VLPATRGEVLLLGQRIDALPSREIARLGVARTFQHVKMIGAMTVLENVALGTHLRGRHGVPAAMLRTDRAEERRLMKEAERQLQRIGMGELMHEQAGNLALGQQRLMEIARALAADPTLLLLDEPAAGLRLKEKEGLATVLRQLRDEGLSILLVEHDMDLVMGLVDRVVVMEFGTKLIEGTPEEVQASPAVRAAYLGTAASRSDEPVVSNATWPSSCLNVRDLHAGYGRAEVLHGLTITARAGKVITVIGPNGAGKSTLLNALMGVLPSRGTVEYDGAPIGLDSLEERVLLGMALVPETRALFGTMSVEDNLLLGAYRQHRLGQKDSAKSLDEVFTLFPRLRERRAQLAGTLSGGERQMLAVGRA
jgi:ABC-type branched-subunit amino acid transport system ATPase component